MRLFGLEIGRAKKNSDARKRSFAAAKVSNMVRDFTTSLENINEDILGGLQNLRARTRDRAKNSSWFRRYLETSQRNIIGPNGIRLNVRSKNPDGKMDATANSKLEAGWKDWGRAENCTSSGGLTWHDIQLFAVRSMKVDGEFFFRKVRGNVNPYGFALEPLDSALCPVQYSIDKGATKVVQGIEFDSFMRPVAYYFHRNVSSWHTNSQPPIRIPANEIIHGFVTEGAGQVRGFPDACGALLSLHMLDRVSEAEAIAVRLSACKMGFYEQDNGANAQTLADEASADGSELVSEMEPGINQILPKGLKFNGFDPKHPTANYAAFVKTQLREVAAGLRLSYNDFANDLEGVNFSSIRGGVLAERDSWMVQQQWYIDHLCRPVYGEWLKMFLLSGVSDLPMTKYDKFHADNWLPRRWQWVDPLKDAKANQLMREMGWKSDSQIVGEHGNDRDEILQQIAADEQEEVEMGVSLGVSPPIAPDDSVDNPPQNEEQ